MHVLDDWLSGRRKMYEHYERARIAIVIRQCVYFDRDTERQRERSGSEAELYQKVRRAQYKPLAGVPGAGEIFRANLENQRKLAAGEISPDELERRRQELLAKLSQ